jgi:GntR family transcriptional regulator
MTIKQVGGRKLNDKLAKKKGSSPLYSQIADDLRFKLLSGEWKAGEKIPPELELCTIYNVSRITIRKAIDELVREGHLYRERAKGTFVLSVDHTTEKEHYTMVRSFTREMEELGKTVHTLKAHVQLIHASERISQQLGIENGGEVLQIRRTRGVDDSKAFAYFVTHIPYIEKFSLDSKDYYGSLYDYLKKFNIVLSESKEYVEAVMATPELQAILEIPDVTPILKRVRMVSSSDGQYKEISDCYYVGDQYRYYVEM